MGQSDPPLIDDGAVFLFQLHKNGDSALRPTIAAQTQLLLIDRLFQTPADEPEIGGVQIEVADGAVAVCVGTQTRSSGGEQLGLLAPGHQILELIPLKDGLFFHYDIPIAAQTQLLLIDRLFQTPADEPEIGGVQIEVADGAVAVCVGTQTRSSGGEQLGLLAPGHQILELIPLKDGLFFHYDILLVLGLQSQCKKQTISEHKKKIQKLLLTKVPDHAIF